MNTQLRPRKSRQTFPSRKLRAATIALGAGALFALTACGAAPEPSENAPAVDEDLIGSLQQAVQNGLSNSYTVDVLNNKHAATGVLTFPWASDGSTWASCGVTFVSKHHAITAAHCVPNNKLKIDTSGFFVYNYNIDELVVRILFNNEKALADRFAASQQVFGTFPNYQRILNLNSDDGYIASSGNPVCLVRARCSSTFGQENCPASLKSVNNGAGVDIALIECPERPAGAPWVRVFSGDESTNQDVEVHWSHEVLNLATTPSDLTGPSGNFDHYMAYDGSEGTGPNEAHGKFDNWHYRGLIFNQFLPLISKNLPDGTPYRTTGTFVPNTDNAERFTNLFACHGTSGSGVFPQNSDRLLGPAVHGGSGWTGNLCTKPGILTSTTNNMSFVRPRHTRVIEAMQRVQSDR
jgi:hypothetical protein